MALSLILHHQYVSQMMSCTHSFHTTYSSTHLSSFVAYIELLFLFKYLLKYLAKVVSPDFIFVNNNSPLFLKSQFKSYLAITNFWQPPKKINPKSTCFVLIFIFSIIFSLYHILQNLLIFNVFICLHDFTVSQVPEGITSEVFSISHLNPGTAFEILFTSKKCWQWKDE